MISDRFVVDQVRINVLINSIYIQEDTRFIVSKGCVNGKSDIISGKEIVA